VKQFKRIAPALLMLGLCTQGPMASLAQTPTTTIDIHAHRFAFAPSEITIKAGETVKLQLFSDDVAHSLRVPGLRINEEFSKGHPGEVIVTPNSVGDFRGECGRFCGSGHGSMLFTIHVKE
jgi:cytochrome c oxidase subunit II